MRYTRAVEREAGLNLALSGETPETFAFRSVQVYDTTRQGVLLPAPARAEAHAQDGGTLRVQMSVRGLTGAGLQRPVPGAPRR